MTKRDVDNQEGKPSQRGGGGSSKSLRLKHSGTNIHPLRAGEDILILIMARS